MQIIHFYQNRGEIMNSLLISKLKIDILIRKQLLNILLSFMNPTSNIMVFLSQNLDKYITLYQKNLFSIYINTNDKNGPNKLNNIAA